MQQVISAPFILFFILTAMHIIIDCETAAVGVTSLCVQFNICTTAKWPVM